MAKGTRGRPRKRAISSVPDKGAIGTPTRRSKRIKASTSSSYRASTPRTSKYFERAPSLSESSPEVFDESSNFEYEAISQSSSSQEITAASGDEEFTSTRTSKSMKSKSASSGSASGRMSAKGGELWRTGVKSNLEPGQEVFVELPKARAAGKVPYQEERMHPNTLLFLGDLKRNNDREWLKVHDADFRQSQKDFNSYIERLTEELVKKDETLPELPTKDIVFRIYRDIRFSKDPTPYKTYFSAAWSRTGRKGPYAAYWYDLQIAPGSSFVGGGLWMPEAASLHSLRRAVDTKSHKLKEILLDANMRLTFLEGASNDEKKVVQSFVEHNSKNALKRKPKGYDDDNPNIDLLRLRNYTIGRKLNDEDILGPNSLRSIANMLGVLAPFVAYLNSVVMPDASQSSSEETEGSIAEISEG